MRSLRATNGFGGPGAVRTVSGSAGPVSLRSLMRQRGQLTRVVKVALLRYSWQMPKSTAGPAKWTDDQVLQIFAAENSWSVSQFWWRNTLGLVEVVYDLHPWRTMPGSQSKLDTTRGAVAALIRAQAQADGVKVDNYDHLCTILEPPAPGNDRGATSAPGDVVVDESPFSHEFFEHETGHLVGYEHSFGLAGDGTWQAYWDDYDVMGYSGDNTRTIPAELPNLPLPANASYWASGRRFAAAGLYRYNNHFASSTSTVTLARGVKQSVRLVALTHAAFGDPALVVADSQRAKITAEYRVAFEDDFAVRQAPVVVLHSIGLRPLPAGAHEVKPIIYESALSAKVGSSGDLDGVTVKITAVDAMAVVLEVTT